MKGGDDGDLSDYYWDSYSHFGIHEEMLKDKIRTDCYRRVILDNSHLFKGKIVLDIGCGTGILSMFAAQTGCELVIGVDASNILDSARAIVEQNGFSDSTYMASESENKKFWKKIHLSSLCEEIVLIKGRIEDVVLPVQKVDIIISEWMGYFLFYENMLSTVIFARDKWLTPNGMIFPDTVNLYIAAIEDAEYKDQKINFWDNVYGFNMSHLKDHAYSEPLIDIVNADTVVTDVKLIKHINVHTVKAEDLTWSSSFILTCKRNDYIHALVSYFDVIFSDGHKLVSFTTSYESDNTHWKQTIFYLRDTLIVKKGDVIAGTIRVNPGATNFRNLDIDLHLTFKNDIQFIDRRQLYKIT